MATKDKSETRGVTAPAAPANDVPAPVEPAPRPAVQPRSTDGDVAEFVARVKSMVPAPGTGRGRLAFAMDATMSREATWDMALALQSEMFRAVKDVGTLDVQLVYFRGMGECRASKWVSDPDALARLMTGVSCRGGRTQIGKILSHARREAGERQVNALVFVGDAMEENPDDLCAAAGELALMGVPVFLFQEGSDERTSRTFKEIARLTKGAWCRFDAGAARQLRDLLTAVAVYAAGGHKALLALSHKSGGDGARLLLTGMKRDG